MNKSVANRSIRIYHDEAGRERAFKSLTRVRSKHRGRRFNYVVFFQDVKGPALNIGNATWVREGDLHVER